VGVDCKFLNFGVHIAKSLKLHGLKVNFPQNITNPMYEAFKKLLVKLDKLSFEELFYIKKLSLSL
jgi:hypothetical protein